MDIKKELDFWVKKRNNKSELSLDASPDPLRIASIYKDEYISLICALFAYGNARAIINFLSSLDFSLLEENKNTIKKGLKGKIYRFQTQRDVEEIFYTLSSMKKSNSLEEIFLDGYQKDSQVISGLRNLITFIYDINPYRSRGYEFLIGKIPPKNPKSAYKRWNMYLRWMVRKDELDLGLWEGVDKSHLLAPLDTHTHKMALKFGLIKRKTYDFKSCLDLSEKFREFDKKDPIKYDFALYRLGQERIEI